VIAWQFPNNYAHTPAPQTPSKPFHSVKNSISRQTPGRQPADRPTLPPSSRARIPRASAFQTISFRQNSIFDQTPCQSAHPKQNQEVGISMAQIGLAAVPAPPTNSFRQNFYIPPEARSQPMKKSVSPCPQKGYRQPRAPVRLPAKILQTISFRQNSISPGNPSPLHTYAPLLPPNRSKMQTTAGTACPPKPRTVGTAQLSSSRFILGGLNIS
jgi:hypothetical protein